MNEYMKKIDLDTVEGNKKRSVKAFNEFIDLLIEEGYELKSEYVKNSIKVILKPPCGHEEYEVKPNDFKRGCRCPECNTSSHGEELTKKLLEQHNINFKREKVFDGLIGLGGKSLRFDFYIPEHSVIIEINGEGHYKEYTKNFLNDNTIIHDKIKRDFCKQQGIKLYDIEYLSTVIGKNNALKHVEERVLEVIRGITA